MAVATSQLPLDFGGRGSEGNSGSQSTRRQRRERIVRIVEYARYPRVSRDQRARVSYSRDESASGMCLCVDDAEMVGELLRVIARGVDGRPTLDTLTRVVWCQPRGDGRYWVGVNHLADGQRRLLRVRHTRHSRKIPVSA